LYIKVKGITIAANLLDRFLLLVSIALPSISYLVLRNMWCCPGIYVTLFYAQFVVLAAVVCKSGVFTFYLYIRLILYYRYYDFDCLVLVDYSLKSNTILPYSLYVTMFLHCLKSCLRSYELFFSLSIGSLCLALSSATYILTIFNFLYWCRLTWSLKRGQNLLAISQEEYFCWVFVLGLAFSSCLAVIATLLWPMPNWQGVKEELLVSYAFGQLGFTVIVTGMLF